MTDSSATRFGSITAIRGSALLITLAFLVILTVLAVGIMETVRTDRVSSSLYADRTAAAVLSQNAVETLVAKLQQTTSDVERHWLSQPGQIVVGAEKDDVDPSNGDSRKILTDPKKPEDNPGATDARIVYLHSGAVATDPSDVLSAPNLNVVTFQDPTSYLITDRQDASGVTTPMRVRWNYVRKSGAVDSSESPDLTNQSDPIIGRYAYWADDESAKVNYNLAWKRDFSSSSTAGKLPEGHPSRIALSALDVFANNPTLADTLHNFITTDNYATLNNRLFNSPADARQVGADVAAALKTNKFEVTHYSHDPDTTFFNEPRIVLTTQAARATGRPYLKILANESSDPGYTANLDASHLNNTLFGTNGSAANLKSPGLVYYLSRTDWPMVAGNGSLQSKYFADDKARLVQFALNIIDYVRSAESSLPIVEPIRGKIGADGKFQGEWLEVNKAIRGQDSTFKGLTRAPLITEMGLLVSSNTNATAKMFMEVYLPEEYGLPSVNLETDFRYIFQVTAQNPRKRWAQSDAVSPISIKASENIVGTNPILKAGQSAVISKTLNFFSMTNSADSDAYSRPKEGAKVALRGALTRYAANAVEPTAAYRTYPIVEVVPIGDPQNTNVVSALFTIPPHAAVGSYTSPGTPPATSIQTDDPRVSGIAPDWTEKAATWGAKNATASKTAVSPQQDTDASGAISKASLVMPALRGSADNPDGVVSSSGELGYIHTGMQVTSTLSAGTPWRTVRLQPSSLPSSVVPDWAFMDLFTPPITVNNAAKPVFAPDDTATGGRVNINSRAEPTGSGGVPFGGERLLPLQAVLLGARKSTNNSTLNASESVGIARNIYDRKLATQGKLYGYTNGFYSQGEVVEIEGVADGGEASEELVRQIANQVTARGNVFSVYTIGQTLKQTPGGKLLITSENRQQAMVERYLDPGTKKVRFRTVYFRPLTP